MTSVVSLMSALTVVLLLTPTSEGNVECYACLYDCNEKDRPKETFSCLRGCTESKLRWKGNGTIYTKRDCQAELDNKTGCKPFDGEFNNEKYTGEFCCCITEFCNFNIVTLKEPNLIRKNRSYALTYQWISLAASLLMTVSFLYVVL